MSTILARPPLRTSLSMNDGHDVVPAHYRDSDDKPFAYRFAFWSPETAQDDQDIQGHYDSEAQVWVTPTGEITMGVATKTRTSGSGCGDCVTDDACF